jgi:hypothetical protein
MSHSYIAKRLIIWTLLVMVSLQGAFAASVLHCLPHSQNQLPHHVSSGYPASEHSVAKFATAMPLSHSTRIKDQHIGVSRRSASGVDHHGSHHVYKVPCCDGVGGSISSFSFVFPPSIKTQVSVEEPCSLRTVFLDGPKRPPRLFSV